ncbi:hypothetical protein HIM_03488 [Hirsutella minnesotensis 3608]|uniref:Urea carboxylase n=1 Tax=Hirsutella minnesotensis 3608 TaxID=1043627 RepID=A0A0F8A2Q8_9HYPO|nr:hypothetical protein HIM_03488 [Hirsutella minnesotensis 3608]
MDQQTPERILIVNRGEIACRILRTTCRLGFHTFSIYTPNDVSSPHVTDADVALPVSSYTDVDAVIDIIRKHHIQYVIPGYGFLSENATFARAVCGAGAIFVGPEPEHISTFGIKDRARNLAASIGVPTCPGSGILSSESEAAAAAAEIGYPVILKATAGGGGMGLQICETESDVRRSFVSVVSRGSTLFQNPDVFLEKYYPVSRHIEVQIFGDGQGGCVALGERECSIQRRHQKIIEESPSPFVEEHPALRTRLFQASRLLGCTIRYASAGTVEYLVDDETGSFFFLEMNTRLQVEHGITEMRFGIDLVEVMIRQARRSINLDFLDAIVPVGHAIEARVYAENPFKNHMPSPGQLQFVELSSDPDVRIDTWVRTGTNVSLAYDPLLAKIIGSGPNRSVAIRKLAQALEATKLQGIVTNVDFLRKILESAAFVKGQTTTNFLIGFSYSPCAMEILSPGSHTTIQDVPGRRGIGFGIPEGGPMDSLHAQLANIVVGNKPGCELLEITYTGPRIKFHQRALIAMAGATVDIQLDGSHVPMYRRIEVPSGSVLNVGALSGGCRVYLAIWGGFPGVPTYLGSKSTSPVVEIGGLQGRQLQAGDILDLQVAGSYQMFELPVALIPAWDSGTVFCMSGPHDSPEIMTQADVDAMYSQEWTISHQASRIGVRLHGPQPTWARQTGGEGGSHPSNYLDYPYAMGALNWTGDTCVIFPADSPSLGGFVSSHVIPRAELFKVGQMKPGDSFRFVPVTMETAMDLRKRQMDYLVDIERLATGELEIVKPLSLEVMPTSRVSNASTAIISRFMDVVIRQAGDSYILVEFLQSLELEVRCRVQAIAEAIDHARIPGVQIITPIGCSLLVEYDCFAISQSRLLDRIRRILVDRLDSKFVTKLTSRHIHLPMVFDDQMNRDSIERYMSTQRPYATYLPDPVEFIARSNGLRSKEEILEKLLSTRILVVGVGFWSGTPIGIPLDPRARLMVPKFNPSRTFSPAGGLGIGGCFFCCDPVDAPGGYVNFGRTLPGWDKFCVNKNFNKRPWLFDNFDQISFYQVDEVEFERLYDRFQGGKFDFDITHVEFDIEEYMHFCESVADEAREFRAKQQAATAIEVEKCVATGARLWAQWQAEQKVERDSVPSLDDIDEALKTQATMHASVYKIPALKGSVLGQGDVLVVLEAMKMEVNVTAPPTQTGLVVANIVVAPGDVVKPGDTLLVLSQATIHSAR